MSGDMAPLFWGFLLGAGVVWLFCCSGRSAGREQRAEGEGEGAGGGAGDGADGEQGGDGEDGQDGSSAEREVVTVEGLAAALRHARSNPDKVTVLRNRLGEIRGPLSGKDVITLLKPVSSRGDRMEVLRLLMPRVHSTVPDKEFDRILSMLSSGDVAEASELLRR